jgi:hypothetical protein
MFDVLAPLEEALDKLAADEGTVDVVRISTLVERLEFQRVRAVSEYDRSGSWSVDNYRSAQSALRAKLRCSGGKAHRLVSLARKLGHLSDTAAAFSTGALTGEHVDEITRPYTPARAEMLEGIEAELVTYGRTSTPAELRDAIKTMVDAFDGDGGGDNDKKQQRLNRVTLSETSGGRGILNGSFDPELTDLVQTALDAEMEVLRQTADPRTLPQLRADSMESIFRWYCAARTNNTARGRGRTNVNLVYDIGGLDISDPALAAQARADTAHGQRLSRTTLERILCDCYISRVISAGHSNILDVGRLTRTVSNALWTALIVRDGHCVEKGCTLEPGHCEAHHVHYWEHGGRTDLDNLVLLCRYHHKQRHLREARKGKRSTHSRTATTRPTAPATTRDRSGSAGAPSSEATRRDPCATARK